MWLPTNIATALESDDSFTASQLSANVARRQVSHAAGGTPRPLAPDPTAIQGGLTLARKAFCVTIGAMVNQPRRRRSGALPALATLMTLAWVGLVFVARYLAADEATAGFGAFIGFFVISLSMVTFTLFMMAVDSDKA